MPRDPTEGLYKACSYCGKGAEEVRKLVSGPRVGICDECAAIVADIIRDTQPVVIPATWEEVVAGPLASLSDAPRAGKVATYRLRVHDGWIVLTTTWPRDGSPPTSSQTFVPDPAGAWRLPDAAAT